MCHIGGIESAYGGGCTVGAMVRGRSVKKRLLGRPEILLLDPVWGRRAGHWLKFSTSNHVASVFTSRAHILPPVQGCRFIECSGPTVTDLHLRYVFRGDPPPDSRGPGSVHLHHSIIPW